MPLAELRSTCDFAAMFRITALFSVVLLIACNAPSSPTEAVTPASEAVRTSAQLTVTAENTALRLTEVEALVFAPAKQALETEIAVFVNPNNTFQSFMGIGGAITDASAEVFSKLSAPVQSQFMDAYFGEGGINYNIVRTSIHSCDFGLGSHTYIEEGDSALTTFDITPDQVKRIPMIKRAASMIGDDLVSYASPWSPPAFMKTNQNMLLGGSLLPEYYQAWANYFVKFIEAYEAEGLPVWGVTIQNEPMATQRWESCIYTAEQERDFLKNNLGPTMEAAGYGDKKIVVGTTTATSSPTAPIPFSTIPTPRSTPGAPAFTGTKPGPAATPIREPQAHQRGLPRQAALVHGRVPRGV